MKEISFRHAVAVPILLLLFTVNSIPLYGQGNFPFPDSAALWVQTYSFMSVQPPLPVEFQVEAVADLQIDGRDTLINSVMYSQLTDAITDQYYGAIMDDAGTVRFVPADSINSYILFDFNVNAGDTINDVICYLGFPGQMTGPQLMTVIVSNVFNDPQWEGRRVVTHSEGAEWIEGIGHRQGLLAEPWINISMYQVMLECMSHNDTVRFMPWAYPPFPGSGACEPLIMQADNQDFFLPTMPVSIFPNPGNDELNIDRNSAASKPAMIEIYSVIGELVRSEKATDPAIRISTSDLPPGCYSIHLIDGQDRSTVKWMKL